jgi:hypothetical protein
MLYHESSNLSGARGCFSSPERLTTIALQEAIMATRSLAKKRTRAGAPSAGAPTAAQLIAESREHLTGPVSLADIAQGIEALLEMVLESIDYEADPTAFPAMVARTLATIAAQFQSAKRALS